MKKSIAIMSIAAIGFMSVPAQAHHNSPDNKRYNRVEKRIDNQRHRIRDGVNSGELTRKETKRLRKQQRKIVRLKREFMRDGYLSRHEYGELNYELNRASKRIHRLKHNDRVAYSRHDRYGRDDRHHRNNRHHRNERYDRYSRYDYRK